MHFNFSLIFLILLHIIINLNFEYKYFQLNRPKSINLMKNIFIKKKYKDE